MTRKLYLVLALSIILGCSSGQDSKVQAPSKSKQFQSKSGESPILSVPLADLRETHARLFRLTPDRRFIRAMENVAEILGAKETVSLTYAVDHWQVMAGNARVGELPDYPDFPDLDKALSGWTSMLLAKHPLHLKEGSNLQAIRDKVETFEPSNLLSALEDIDKDRRAGIWSAEEVGLASRTLALLAAQSLDNLQLADSIVAKALAASALARSLQCESVPSDVIRLRILMGYSHNVKDAAAKLSDSDPVRAFVFRDEKNLSRIAASPSRSAEARFYMDILHPLPEDAAIAGFRRAVQVTHSLPAIKNILDGSCFGCSSMAVAALPVVVAEVEGSAAPGPISEPSISGMTERFERALKARQSDSTSVLADDSVYQSFYRGWFYGLLEIQGLYYVDSLSSMKEAHRFHAALDSTQPGVAAHFRVWYGHLLEFVEQKGQALSAENDIDTMPDLGPRLLGRSYDLLSSKFTATGFEWSRDAQRLISQLDTRPSSRPHLAGIAYHRLGDINMAEDLCASVEATGGTAGGVVWCISLVRGPSKLLDYLHEREHNPVAARTVFNLLRTHAELDAVEPAFEKAIQEWPDDMVLRADYAVFLEQRKEYGKAAAELRSWVQSHDSSYGFDYINARRLMAHMMSLSGDNAGAWQAIEPVIDSWQAATLIEASNISDRLGYQSTSLKYARAASERYPDSVESRSNLARLYWRHDNNDAAVATLQDSFSPYPIPSDAWCLTVAPEFAEEFSNRTREAAVKAVDALLDAHVPYSRLMCFANKLKDREKYDAAFGVQTELIARGATGTPFLLDGYDCLRRVSGSQKAADWLKLKTASKKMPEVAYTALVSPHLEDHREVLWDVVHTGTGEREDESVWLARTINSIYVGPKDTHRQELLDHYKSPATSWEDHIAKYLLGLESKDEIASQVTSSQRRCEFAYYTGMLSRGEGKYRDAVDWFRIAIETGQQKDIAYMMAYATLFDWAKKAGTVSAVAAQRL